MFTKPDSPPKNRYLYALLLWQYRLSALASLLLAASVQAQTPVVTQTFDGYTTGANVPVGAGQTFLSSAGNPQTVNTNAATFFPGVSSASSLAAGDAATNYVLYGTVASSRLRTNSFTVPAGLYSAVYDINQTIGTGVTGGTLFSVVNNAAADVNGGSQSLTSFSLAATTGIITPGGNNVTLTGGSSTTIPLNAEVVLSLVVNPTAAAINYTNANFNAGNAISLPAYNSDLYATGANGAAFYVGRLTPVSGTGITQATNPNQLGLANFSGTNTPNLRINELDVYSNAVIAAIPEPSAYVALASDSARCC